MRIFLNINQNPRGPPPPSFQGHFAIVARPPGCSTRQSQSLFRIAADIPVGHLGNPSFRRQPPLTPGAVSPVARVAPVPGFSIKTPYSVLCPRTSPCKDCDSAARIWGAFLGHFGCQPPVRSARFGSSHFGGASVRLPRVLCPQISVLQCRGG